MERVVYILGAGFSAPMGIPTVPNFIQQAKDFFFREPLRYDHFKEIISDINNLARAKVIFNTDTYDLEEVLSFLQTEKELGEPGRTDAFVRLIQDVVNDSTLQKPANIGHFDWRAHFGTTQTRWTFYMQFVASLFRLALIPERPEHNVTASPKLIEDKIMIGQPYVYDVVSLNYDCILEDSAALIGNKFCSPTAPWLTFKRDENAADPIPDTGGCHRPLLAKLHGCSRMGGIIAPTANKRLDTLQNQWKMAYDVLKKANYVRIIGYSLPVGDAAVRYLLKTALSKAENLKNFDVLCLDNGGVEARYRDFVTFRPFRFSAGDTVEYLGRIQPSAEAHLPHAVCFGKLEEQHRQFFG